MANIYIIPTWFFAYSIILEIAFALITSLVAIYSFKIYNLCNQKEYKAFGVGFIFISLSYVIWAFVNLFLLDKISDSIQALSLQEFISIGSIGIYMYMIFTLLGLATLAYTTLKTNNNKIYSLIVIITILALTFSANKALAFHVLSSIFIIFLISHYLIHYMKTKKHKNLLIPIAFILLFVSHIHFMFAINHYTYYVIGHITELIAYILVLTRLILIIKK
ncbi:MAG: hypothetical protein AABX03_03470 [Nanoarchaeota archaeon]